VASVALTFSPVGFGAFKIGRNEKIKYERNYPLPSDNEVSLLLNAVLDMGVTYIDTAPAYGVSEARVGAAISHRKGEFTLSTKVGESFEDGESSYDFSAEGVRRSVERSLRRLRVDALDLVFLHCPGQDVETLQSTDAVETLLQCKASGSVRAVGVSAYMEEAFRLSLPWADAIMVEYHPNDVTLSGVIAEAGAAGVSVIVKKPLASGRLRPWEAIPFILSNEKVKSLVIGALSVEHMRENVRIATEARQGR
jgi:aryl-alcohol dehydrogenase-like predicted oxidoreductase